MSQERGKIRLSPLAEGLVGAGAGTLLGLGLWHWNVISAPAIAGVTLGLGLGSWVNAWRRAKDKGEET